MGWDYSNAQTDSQAGYLMRTLELRLPRGHSLARFRRLGHFQEQMYLLFNDKTSMRVAEHNQPVPLLEANSIVGTDHVQRCATPAIPATKGDLR
jgi:hypothetical protein